MTCMILGGVCALFALMCAQCVSMMGADKYQFIARLYHQHGIADHLVDRYVRAAHQLERCSWPTSALIKFTARLVARHRPSRQVLKEDNHGTSLVRMRTHRREPPGRRPLPREGLPRPHVSLPLVRGSTEQRDRPSGLTPVCSNPSYRDVLCRNAANGQEASMQVFAVHVTVTNKDDPCPERPIDHIASTDRLALEEARRRSLVPGTLGAAVTQFVVDGLGEHKRVALFVRGERQKEPHFTDNNVYIPG